MILGTDHDGAICRFRISSWIFHDKHKTYFTHEACCICHVVQPHNSTPDFSKAPGICPLFRFAFFCIRSASALLSFSRMHKSELALKSIYPRDVRAHYIEWP